LTSIIKNVNGFSTISISQVLIMHYEVTLTTKQTISPTATN